MQNRRIVVKRLDVNLRLALEQRLRILSELRMTGRLITTDCVGLNIEGGRER